MYKYISIIQAFLHYRIHVLVYEAHLEPIVMRIRQWWYIRKLRKKDVINVVFFPMNVAMWKYQHLYELLKLDKRFRLYVFLAPASNYSYESRCSDLHDLRSYFKANNVPFIDFELERGKEVVDIRSIVDPDILFYAQPYEKSIETNYDFVNFEDRLLSHIPYGFGSSGTGFYNNNIRFNNLAWKLYYPTEESKDLARRYAYNHGQNVVVVGYSGTDDYLTPMINDPWKIKDRSIKRIVWAPHFTIIKGIGFAQVSNFLNMAEYMQQLAINYSDKVAFAFKPHPRLYSELVSHPEWGETRTMNYYNFWKNSPSTQLEMGDFVDLFKGSDGMIHDSCSFTVDYLYFKKPVLYDNPDVESAKRTANKTSKKAYDVHYKVSSNEDIKRFIDDVVIAGNDPMKAQREAYYQHYLLPPNGKSVAQNIYDDMIKSLGLK